MTKRVLHICMVLLVIASFLIPLFYFSDLPVEIPIHYNANGQVTNAESKETIWLLPVISVLLTAVLMALLKMVPQEKKNKIPKNFPPYFAEILGIYIISTLLFVNITTIRVGLGYQNGIGSWFLPTFIGITVLGLLFMIWRQVVAERNEKNS